MLNLLSKLSSSEIKKPIQPRDIFMSLPAKDKRYEYPRDVQSEVWKKWYDVRDRKENIIKMNTGSGKTVVGLMILQSCLNERKGPAIYVVPDKYLVEQVCDEAKALGIRVTQDQDDYYYTNNESILVIPIHKLVNGRSVFGMNKKYPIGSILIDDVHACMDTIVSQFTLHIPEEHGLYKEIVACLGEQWRQYNIRSYTDIVELKDSAKTAYLPFWIWQDQCDTVYRLLKKYDNSENKFIYFTLPFVEDYLKLCSCIITSTSIEISPKEIPISQLSSFTAAQRRIFMSATLADDSVFVSSMGVKVKDIDSIITPDHANDIGDRLILFPKHLNHTITDDDIKNKVKEIAQNYNVVVIVPSFERAKYWVNTNDEIAKKDSIKDKIHALKEGYVGLTVIVNRYEGIDLPDNACRMLVLDGIPPHKSEYEKYVNSIDLSNELLLKEQIQRIEQGMGRGVRSNNDSCCIVLMGDELADVLLRGNGINYFSTTTLTQYKLSQELWGLLKKEITNPTVDNIFELAEYSLTRAPEWIMQSKERISEIEYCSSINISPLAVSLREAFDAACIKDYGKSITCLDQLINATERETTKGYLLQLRAEYTNLYDKTKAQEILLTARKYNQLVLAPLCGITYEKILSKKNQAIEISNYFRNKAGDNPNQCILFVNSIMSKLVFSSDANSFENTLQEVGLLLGFTSSRPDLETNGKGPDNLWGLNNDYYLVIECKSGVDLSVASISKDYCNQLGGSIRWFESEYGKNIQKVPVMVHATTVIDSVASPPMGMRIITPDMLRKLADRIRSFIVSVTANDNWLDSNNIYNSLQTYKLRASDFLTEYSLPCQKKRV